MLARIKRVFLDDGSESSLVTLRRKPSLLGYAEHSSRLLVRDEVRTGHRLRVGHRSLLQLIRILADVVKQFLPIVVLPDPLCNVVVWLLLLKALEDPLVLGGDLHKLFLAGLSVQTALATRRSVDALLHRLVDRRQNRRAGVCIRDALRVLENAGHLF